jgi:hypothetical protein
LLAPGAPLLAAQTSTSEVRGIDQSHGRRDYTCRNRPSASLKPRECGQCIRPRDEKDIGRPASRPCGRSLASLFNRWSPHRSIGQRAPCAPVTFAPHRRAQAGSIVQYPCSEVSIMSTSEPHD